ncbi:hypothetical protein MKW98_006171 [Papaver atlanticum]|uniref:Uncharacterized protein n=1 Tax=Papaver atlanticum TaxID=357466 RepID=A0AAD4TH38_9MAGN|nr:hypothetical protein MKW98_006171 [Papaver atlanticum]
MIDRSSIVSDDEFVAACPYIENCVTCSNHFRVVEDIDLYSGDTLTLCVNFWRKTTNKQTSGRETAKIFIGALLNVVESGGKNI